jgi:hypothetical protein
MVQTDTLEGTIDDKWWFHYDAFADVLYIRLADEMAAKTVGEETDEGFILLRRMKDDEPIGVTVVSWWKRFGQGKLPDSIRKITEKIAPWTKKVAA